MKKVNHFEVAELSIPKTEKEQLIDEINFSFIGANIFNSLDDCVSFLKNTQANPQKFNKLLMSLSKDYTDLSTEKKSSNDWAGKKSLTKSINSLENWHNTKISQKVLNEIKRDAKKLLTKNEFLKTSYILKNACFGAPNVPRFLKGLPKTAKKMEKVENEIPRKITLLIDLSESCLQSAKQVIKKYKSLLTIAYLFELSNIQFELYIGSLTGKRHYVNNTYTIFTSFIKFKSFSEKLNIKKVWWMLTSVESLRKISFRLIEYFEFYDNKEIKKLDVDVDISCDYGQCISFNRIAKFKKANAALWKKVFNTENTNYCWLGYMRKFNDHIDHLEMYIEHLNEFYDIKIKT